MAHSPGQFKPTPHYSVVTNANNLLTLPLTVVVAEPDEDSYGPAMEKSQQRRHGNAKQLILALD